jgi:hypothetical protein
VVYSDQVKYTDFQSADFNFRRIRLSAKYQAAKWVGSALDLKVENLIGQTNAGTTKIGAIQEAIVWFKPGFLGTTIKAGQFKLPFSRELASASTNHMFAEPSYVTKLIQENDLGLYLMIQPLDLLGSEWTKKLDIMFSYTNGDGGADAGNGNGKAEFNSITTTPSNIYNASKLLNWRIQINPFGGPVKDGKEADWKDGDEIFYSGDSILWSIGAAGAYSAGWEGQAGWSSGTPVTSPFFTATKPFSAHTFDTTLSAFGVYVNGEYTTATTDTATDGVSKTYTTYQGTLGYNLKLDSIYLMPLVRYNYQEYDANSNKTIDDNEKYTSIWIGANLFAIKHNLKFQVFYNIVNNVVSSTDSTKPLGLDVFYFQIQSAFGKKI